MDPRMLRSLQRLTHAVYELASERPVDELTVAEIARVAGLNRSTFYRHAASPRDLLVRVLLGELDAARSEHLAAVDDPAAAIEAVTAAVLDHVERHAALYVIGMDSGLRAVLSAHFRNSIEQLLELGVIRPPSAEPTVARMTAAFIAEGTAGAIAAWLLRPAPRDRAAFLRAYRLVLPAWWPWHA